MGCLAESVQIQNVILAILKFALKALAVTHILANGSWQHGTAQPANEPGAPNVSNVQVNDTSTEIGPFTTAGIYHLYCTIHQGMNLTIRVQ